MLMSKDRMHVLGLSGSLRRESFNRQILELAGDVAPASLSLSIHDGLGALPLFNEDLEGEDCSAPPAVQQMRDAIAKADALLIATPEYNQSMPGVLKNAIDWLSRSAPASAFEDKPIALCGITTGEWGTRLSQAALRQTLFAAGARLVPLHLYLRKAPSLFEPGGVPGASVTRSVRDFMAALAAELASAHARCDPEVSAVSASTG